VLPDARDLAKGRQAAERIGNDVVGLPPDGVDHLFGCVPKAAPPACAPAV